MRRALSALLWIAAATGHDAAGGGTLGLVAAGHRIEAEVADTPDALARGLMFRTAMAADAGMLFVYPGEGYYCMWMRNTYLPLSVAFLDERAEVINIAEMAPRTDISHCAARPARYALEMRSGWFREHGIDVGMRIDFPTGAVGERAWRLPSRDVAPAPDMPRPQPDGVRSGGPSSSSM